MRRFFRETFDWRTILALIAAVLVGLFVYSTIINFQEKRLAEKRADQAIIAAKKVLANEESLRENAKQRITDLTNTVNKENELIATLSASIGEDSTKIDALRAQLISLGAEPVATGTTPVPQATTNTSPKPSTSTPPLTTPTPTPSPDPTPTPSPTPAPSPSPAPAPVPRPSPVPSPGPTPNPPPAPLPVPIPKLPIPPLPVHPLRHLSKG